jgi:hypothetical protein
MHLYESAGEPWLVLYYYVQSVELILGFQPKLSKYRQILLLFRQILTRHKKRSPSTEIFFKIEDRSLKRRSKPIPSKERFTYSNRSVTVCKGYCCGSWFNL